MRARRVSDLIHRVQEGLGVGQLQMGPGDQSCARSALDRARAGSGAGSLLKAIHEARRY
jgi:hypothetical protein